MDLNRRRLRPISKLLGAALVLGLLTALLGACANQRAHSRVAASHRSTGHAKPTTTSEYVVTPESNYPHLRGPVLSLALTSRLLGYPKVSRSLLKEQALLLAYYDGQLAGATDTRRAAATVRRYYETAARDDARRACSMVVPSLAKALPVDYGKYGEAYLRGAKTCQAVLGRIFRHSHSILTVPPTVRGLLTHGAQGYAFISSRRMRVSVIQLQRSAGGWAIDSPMGAPAHVAGPVRD